MSQQSQKVKSLPCIVLSTCLLLAVFSSGFTAEARSLRSGGDVTSKTTIHFGEDGSKAKGAQEVYDLTKLKTDILLAEAHCKAHGWTKCEEVEKLKKKLPKKKAGKKVTAKCHVDPVGSWFFGTLCVDAEKEKPKSGDRRRSLLTTSAAKWTESAAATKLGALKWW